MRPRSITSLVLGLAFGLFFYGQGADFRNIAAAGTPGLVSLDNQYEAIVVKRQLQIARLRDYAERGVFPINKDFPGQFVPYFVDEVGTACAVGHLMLMDGQAFLVAKIAAATNHIRIENVNDGPLLTWILDSGLTKDECALIQPGYATIEDYRRGREWQAEHERLVRHFATVESTLIDRSLKSLREALIAKVDVQIAENPDDPALAVKELKKSLSSDEPNVRIAAAHAVARIADAKASLRLAILEPNLSHPNFAVKFWTAVAIQEIGAASPIGTAELHGRTLPVFLETAQSKGSELRLAALVQLANTTPMTMGTNRQFRIMPEIRRTMVDACTDEARNIQQFANSVLRSWRWQRIVYESQRMLRVYLAESADLEALATETATLEREFATEPKTIGNILESRSIYDTPSSIIYMLPIATETPLPTANSTDEAKQLVDDRFKRSFEKYRGETESPWPFWKIVSVDTDESGLYYTVVAIRTDYEPITKLIYVIPRPAMLTKASSLPYYWFKRKDSPMEVVRTGKDKDGYLPNKNADVVLGDLARKNLKAFTTSCDIFAYFLAHHSQLVIDRTVEESPKSFTWTGRFAMLRSNKPRFSTEGVGSHAYGNGGWDFNRFTIRCNRDTGQLDFSAAAIEYPVIQLPDDILHPQWVTQELKLMGWKPLESLDFFGDRLLPSEYHRAINAFNPDDPSKASNLLRRRYAAERSLPNPGLVLGLLHERAGQREAAIRNMNSAAGSGRYDANSLADVARWKLSVGLHDDARKHAEAALALFPEHQQANHLIRQLDGTGNARSQD